MTAKFGYMKKLSVVYFLLISLMITHAKGNCDDAMIRINGIGQFADMSLNGQIIGMAEISGGRFPDIFFWERVTSKDCYLYEYVRHQDGIPVFSRKCQIKMPGGLGKFSNVQQKGDDIYLFWINKGKLGYAVLDKEKKAFIKEGMLPLPEMEYGTAGFQVVFNGDEGIDVFALIETLKETRIGHWRRADYFPYDGSGVYRGNLARHALGHFSYSDLRDTVAGPLRLLSQKDLIIGGATNLSLGKVGDDAGVFICSFHGGIYWHPFDKDGNVSQWRVIGRDGNALRHPVIGPRPFVYPSIDKRKTSLIINGDGAAFYFTSGDVCPDSRRLVLNNEGFLKEKNPVMYGGALVVPTVVDYDGDGTLDVVAGNAAGNILFFRNYGTDRTPVFRIGEKLKAGGVDIHIQPGYGEDIQGPIESRWGYVGPNVYDWNGDGFLDILTNDSRGKHRIFIGTDEGLKPEAPLYLNDIPLHGTWRCRPGVGVLAGKTVYITLDDQDEFHLYYREDDYNLKDGGKLLLTDGCSIKANWLEAGGKGRLRFDLVDWDGDGVKDLLLSTNKHHKIPADAPDGLPWTNPKKLQGSTILFMRNTGTEGAPVFDAPRQLSCKGRLIQLGHHACGAVACFLGEIIDDKPNILAADERGAFYLLNRADLTW